MIIRVSEASLPFLLGLLGLCLALSAFFSGTETALMSFNRYQLRTMANSGHRGAILAEKLLNRPDRLIGLILLGNNLVNNLAAVLITVITLRLWGEEWLAVAAGLLTLVMLIFCEVGPKTYGALHPRRLAVGSAYIYIALQWLLRPAVFTISWITNGALRLVGLNVDRQTQQTTLSREELRTVVAEAGVMIPQSHQKMLMGILDLERITVNDIMIPRQEIAGIDLDDDWERILEQLRQTPHTRLPVYRGDINEMIGLVHMRRIAQELARDSLDRERLEEVARQREPYFVPESTSLTVQLANFQRDRRRFAFVVDEYGAVLGLVTLEDILEEIVGEFTSDPATISHRDVHREPSGAFIVNASAHIRVLNRTLHWQLPTDGPKTLNGLLLERLETIPHAGTSLRIGRLEMEVLQIADNAVRTVRVTERPQASAAESDVEGFGEP
jgi:Mg2+/Co2+ transporter CorB